MKIDLLIIEGQKPTWSQEPMELFAKKIKPFVEFNVVILKSKKLRRDNKEEKIKYEEELLLNYLKKSSAYNILFDEKGKSFKDSREFSKNIQNIFERGQSKINFIIGGPYGVSDKIRETVQLRVSLSGLTFNHHVASVVVMEQIYRALSIWKGLPYHND